MCFFGGSSKGGGSIKIPDPVPPPAPDPVPVASDPSPTTTADQRTKQISALKQGVLSTITSGSSKGITGSGPDLAVPSAAGSMFPSMSGSKKTLGS